MEVAVAAPSVGVMNVGEVEKTRFVDVVPVVPAAVKPVMLLKQVIEATMQFVPPRATVTGAVSEIVPEVVIVPPESPVPAVMLVTVPAWVSEVPQVTPVPLT
jgi:hypothetical protein